MTNTSSPKIFLSPKIHHKKSPTGLQTIKLLYSFFIKPQRELEREKKLIKRASLIMFVVRCGVLCCVLLENLLFVLES